MLKHHLLLINQTRIIVISQNYVYGLEYQYININNISITRF